MSFFQLNKKNAPAVVILIVIVTSLTMIFDASAASPPSLPGARLIRPTQSAVSGTTAFEADLAQSSPQDDSTVAFTLYRLIDGNPENGRFCFLSPTATHLSGSSRWIISSVDTRTITGNCSSSQTLTGTLQAPRDGTYRFGIWIDGTEYITPDSVTIQNGNLEDVPVEEEPPPPPQNQNTNSNQNQNTNQPPANSNANTNTPANTNTGPSANINQPGQNANTNTNSPGNQNASSNANVGSPAPTNTATTAGPTLAFVVPAVGAQIQDTVTVTVSVTGARADEVDEVVFSVYAKSVWYTVGRAQNDTSNRWTIAWDTTQFPNGTVFGMMRAYLVDDSVYATDPREFVVANTGSATQPPSNGTNGTNQSPQNTNGQNEPPVSLLPPVLDTDNDGTSDTQEIILGTNPHRPDNAPRRRLFSALPPSQPITSTDETLDERLSVTAVTGPGITAVEKKNEGEKQLYRFTGTGTVFDYLTLYIYSEENPLVFPVQVNAISTWITNVDITLESGTHSAYVALLNDDGEILKRSNPFAFTVDPSQLEKDLSGNFPWVWVILGILILGGAGGWYFYGQSSGTPTPTKQ